MCLTIRCRGPLPGSRVDSTICTLTFWVVLRRTVRTNMLSARWLRVSLRPKVQQRPQQCQVTILH